MLVIGKQVQTAYGGKIDLLCLNSAGDTVVVELKKGKTPREVAAQTLDYTSWTQDLSYKEITVIAANHFGNSDQLEIAFLKQFGVSLPNDLNQTHSSLIVAESIDASTERIVRYLSDMGVPINVATVQYFKDGSGRSILARVYLMEPERVERTNPKRQTMSGLQEMAEGDGLGALFGRIRNGVRGVLHPEPYVNRVWYKLQRKEGGFRTILIVNATRQDKSEGLGFTVHATRLREHVGIGLEQLKACLPETTEETEGVRGWSGSSEDERKCAVGLEGYLQSEKEVDKLVDALKDAISRS